VNDGKKKECCSKDRPLVDTAIELMSWRMQVLSNVCVVSILRRLLLAQIVAVLGLPEDMVQPAQ
jgi:hypothetical protein